MEMMFCLYLGIQLDSWLMVMVIMDLTPLAWCLFMTVRNIIIDRLRRSYIEDTQNNLTPSNYSTNITHSNPLRTIPHSLIETAELLSLTMRRWSPAYQLNEIIMKHVDGCIFGHASCCKFVISY